MKASAKRLAMFPGMFDPMTNGHLDVIRRAAGLYDEVVVAIGDNPDKGSFLSQQDRAKLVEQVIAGLSNVRVATYKGLTIKFATEQKATVIIRGIRDSMDLQEEVQMAEVNRSAGGVETVFLPTAAAHAFLSSGLIRQIARGGGDVSRMVPPQALAFIAAASRKA